MNAGLRMITRSGRPPPAFSRAEGRGTWTRDWTASATSATAASSTNEPRKGMANMSLPQRLSAGPRKPPTMPPASTQRNGTRLVGRRGNLGRGKAILQSDGVVDADDGSRQAVQHEAPEKQSRRRKHAAADVDDRAGHESAPAAHFRHPQRHRHRGKRGAQHIGGRAQRRERLDVGQCIADQTVHRDQSGGVGQQQRLAAREQEYVAVGGGHRWGGAGAPRMPPRQTLS